jgi:hypothetical protein
VGSLGHRHAKVGRLELDHACCGPVALHCIEHRRRGGISGMLVVVVVLLWKLVVVVFLWKFEREILELVLQDILCLLCLLALTVCVIFPMYY